VEVNSHSFFTSALDGNSCQNTAQAALPTWKGRRYPRYMWQGAENLAPTGNRSLAVISTELFVPDWTIYDKAKEQNVVLQMFTEYSVRKLFSTKTYMHRLSGLVSFKTFKRDIVYLVMHIGSQDWNSLGVEDKHTRRPHPQGVLRQHKRNEPLQIQHDARM
jgi:hypothetical protein